MATRSSGRWGKTRQTLYNHPLARSLERWLLAAALLFVVGRPESAAAATVASTWVDGDGFWSTAGNWDPAVVPNNTATDTYAVTIENGSTVTLDTSVSVDTVLVDFVSPPASTLVLGAGQTLNVNQLVNLSLVGVAGPGTGALASSGSIANVGTLFATGGGNLLITNSQVNSNGTILAQDGSMVSLQNTSVSGGTLTTQGSGVILASQATLQNLTNAGLLTIDSNEVALLSGTVTNTGTITNTAASLGHLGLQGGTLVNTGTVQASGGGTLLLFDGTVNNSSGTIAAQNGSVLQLGAFSVPVTVSGGTLTTQGSGNILVASGTTLQDLTNAGLLTVDSNALPSLSGTVTNTGIITNAGSAGHLDNTGATLVNNGTMRATNDGTLAVVRGTFTNNGAIVVDSGSTFLSINQGFGTFTNFSSATATLTGGSFVVSGTLQFDDANIVHNAANITLDGGDSQVVDQVGQDAFRNFASNAGGFTLQGGRSLTTPGGFTNSGTMTVAAGSLLSIGGATYVQTAGTTILNGELATGSLVDIRGGTLSGNGLVANNLNNGGTVSPGNSPGTLSVTGDYRQTATGILDIEIGGLLAGVQYDVLRVFGNAFLDGLLDVSLIDGFDPTVGDTFDILLTGLFLPGSVTGRFATVDLPTSSFGAWQVEYLSDRVRLDFESTEVAEPPTILLMIGGLSILLTVHRRRCDRGSKTRSG